MNRILPSPSRQTDATSAKPQRGTATAIGLLLVVLVLGHGPATPTQAAPAEAAAGQGRPLEVSGQELSPRPKQAPAAETAPGKPSQLEGSRGQAPIVPAQSQPPVAGREIYQRLLRGTAFIACDVSEDWSSMSFGTGWLLDRDRRLMITNHHVVAQGDGVMPERIIHVFFPHRKDGELLTDRWEYVKQLKGIKARIIDTDSKRDLALLVLEDIPNGVEPLALSDVPISPGDRVHQLGNPGASDAMWVYTSGTVRQVYKTRTKLSNGQACEYLRVETQSPTNPGDSGGPVVNDAGQVVAVHHASFGGGQLMTYFVDARELKAFLQEAQPLFDPQSAEQYNDRGVHYYERGRYDKAVEDFTKALELDPKLADAAGNRGWALVQQDDSQTALADFDAAIGLNPADANFWQGRGKAHVALDETSAAIKDFTEAIRLSPQEAELYNERADAYYEAEDYSQALKDYNHAIRIDPRQADYYNSRGVCHAAQEDYAAAIADYTKAIELSAGPVYFHNRGIAKHEEKKYEEAAYDFMLMQRLDADYAKAHVEHFNRKVVRIRNNTDETLTVWLKYRTQTSDGQWKWFPDDPDKDTWSAYTFAPGEEAFVEHDDFQINADRVRIWIFNKDRSHVWEQFRDQDYVLVGDEGYDGYLMDVHKINIQ